MRTFGVGSTVLAVLVTSIAVSASPAQATSTQVEVGLDAGTLMVTTHPGAGTGDILISLESGSYVVRVDPDSGGAAQLWSTDRSCNPATGSDALEVRCAAPSIADASAVIDVTQTDLAGSQRTYAVIGNLPAEFYGSPFADYFQGGSADDYIEGDDGADRLFGGAGDDEMYGGAGADVLEGERGADTIEGGAGPDTIDVKNDRDPKTGALLDRSIDVIDCNDDASRGTDNSGSPRNSATFDKGSDGINDTVTDCGTGSVSPPVNTARPTIVGTPAVGTAVTGTLGTWTGADLSYSYKWASCVNTSNPYTDCKDVVAKTVNKSAMSYTPKEADKGRLLLFSVFAKNAGGEVEMTSTFSSPVAAATTGKPANVTKPSLPPVVEVGQAITADKGTWTGSGLIFTFQWKACQAQTTPVAQCTDPAGGGDYDVFTPALKDKGKYLLVIVTATNAKRESVKATSERRLIELVTKPDAPTNTEWKRLSATLVELKWTAPVNQGGRPVTEYRLEYWSDSGMWMSGFTYKPLKTVYANFTTHEVVSLPTTQYWFRIAAVNSKGQSAWATLGPVSTSPPPPPNVVSAVRSGASGARVWWDQASYTRPGKDDYASDTNKADILEWQLDYRSAPWPADRLVWSEYTELGRFSSPSANVSQLSMNTRYQFRVRARNETGWGEWKEGPYVTIDNKQPPSEVRNVSVRTWGDPNTTTKLSGLGGQLLVEWDRPLDDGVADDNASLSYAVTASPGNATCAVNNQWTGTRYSCVVSGLKDGTPYSISIRTTNGGGGESVVSAGTFTPYGEPGAPKIVGTPKYGKKGKLATATITWEWPADAGGFSRQQLFGDLMDKEGTKFVSFGRCGAGETSCVVEGLEPGRADTIWIRVGTPRGYGPRTQVTLTPPR